MIESIKDRKIQYFYKRELKSLFFNKLRNFKNEKKINYFPKKFNSLKKKQIYSFIASAINHNTVRQQIVKTLLDKLEFNKIETNILEFISLDKLRSIGASELLENIESELREYIVTNVTISSVYKLFPYSDPKYDPQLALLEIKESTNNLNTRLSNLKKINKSLNTFDENKSSLNWEELQKISKGLDKDLEDY